LYGGDKVTHIGKIFTGFGANCIAGAKTGGPVSCLPLSFSRFDRATTRVAGEMQPYNRRPIMLQLVLVVFLVILLLGALPTWPYSSGWGYYPSGGLGLVLLILLLALVFRS
jgi:hypothetical protein